MFNGTLISILLAFVFYMAIMVVIGAICMKKTSNSEDYFLGGRGLSGWVAALSAQASDMSGWLLMGLPGAVYAFGTRDFCMKKAACQTPLFEFSVRAWLASAITVWASDVLPRY